MVSREFLNIENLKMISSNKYAKFVLQKLFKSMNDQMLSEFEQVIDFIEKNIFYVKNSNEKRRKPKKA